MCRFTYVKANHFQKIRFYLYFLTTFLILPLATGDLGDTWRTFTYQDLVKLIKDNRVTSIEQLTHLLPEELQTNITFRLIPHNRLQEGPRAIRFTSDGRLTITHSTDPKAKGGLNIEIFEKTASDEGVLHDIEFSKDGKSLPKITEGHPHGAGTQIQTCTGCHGSPPRKIWPTYRTWLDAGGEEDDHPNQKCLDFLKSAKQNPRLKDLNWDQKNPAWPYTGSAERALRTMPNTRLSYIVQIDNAKQMAKTMMKSDLYGKLKYTLFDQEICPQDSQLNSRIQSDLSRSPEVNLPNNWMGTKSEYIKSVLTYVPQYTPSDYSSKNYPGTASKLFEFFGIPYGTTGGSEKFERNASTGISVNSETIYNRGSQTYLIVQLLQKEAQQNPVIKKILSDGKVDYPRSSESTKSDYNNDDFYKADKKFQNEFENSFLLNKALRESCAYFRSQSLKELDRLEESLNGIAECETNKIASKAAQADLSPLDKRQIIPISNLTGPLQDLVLAKGKEILKTAKCITCHDPSSGHSVGPPIRFTNPKKFAEDDNEFARSGMDVVSSARLMMSDETPYEKRMPLNNPSLTPEEREAVVEYLRFMSGSQRSQGLEGPSPRSVH